MNLQIDEGKFALKYAIFYTSIITLLLLLPLFIYTNYSYNLQEAKTEIELKKQAYAIINEIEKFGDSGQKTFLFPRSKSITAGLYDANKNPIFTLMTSGSIILNSGYHSEGTLRNLIIEFNHQRYFKAKYLVLQTQFDYLNILKDFILALFSIILIAFALSFFILRNFAKPFTSINKALDIFIKDSMHEINTPLSIININVDMFSEKFGKNKYLARIKSASKILSTIYNDMNYLIKENSIANAPIEHIHMSEFVLKSIDYFGDVAELKGISVEAQISPDIYYDFVPAKLQKIVDNNLSNAIKYSKEESKVIISLVKQQNQIILGFKDFGIGIKEPDKIFSRYYREDNTKGGFGIGLNIVKKIVLDEHIEVKLESEFGKGSYFEYRFTL